MKKPNGYDEARESGRFTPVELGGHYATIKQVTETKSKSGKDMIVVLFDFCHPDAQENYFSTQFQNDTRDEVKWPFSGTKYIMVYDYQDENKTSSNFKSFCTCFEDSNNCMIVWGGADWSKQFKNKRIGIVFGEEEHEYDGKVTMRRVPKWFTRWDKVADASVPAPRYLNNNQPALPFPQESKNDFMSIPEGESDTIPF